jgi:hypothetical protein
VILSLYLRPRYFIPSSEKNWFQVSQSHTCHSAPRASGLGWGLSVTPPLIYAVRTCKTFTFPLLHSHLRSHVPYCVDSLILAAVCSADFSNVLST